MLSGLMSRCRKRALCTTSRPESSGSKTARSSGSGSVAQALTETRALLVDHDDVGRAVGREITQHAHDIGVLELHQSFRFLAETLDAPGEQLLLLGVARLDRDAVGRAAREGAGQILL